MKYHNLWPKGMADQRKIKCRFCEWVTPLYMGRKTGWSRLVDHIDSSHPDVDLNRLMIVTGTTVKGYDTYLKMKEGQ